MPHTVSRIPATVLTAAKKARLQKALAHLQEAQNHLGSACGDLSALCGAVPQWRKASKLYDQVHAFWYQVDGLKNRDRVFLDSTNVHALELKLTNLLGGRDLAQVTVQDLVNAMRVPSIQSVVKLDKEISS